MQFYSKKKSEKRRKAIVEEYIVYPSTPLEEHQKNIISQ